VNEKRRGPFGSAAPVHFDRVCYAVTLLDSARREPLAHQ